VSVDPEVLASTFDDRIDGVGAGESEVVCRSGSGGGGLDHHRGVVDPAAVIRWGVARARVLTVFAAHAVVVWSAVCASSAPADVVEREPPVERGVRGGGAGLERDVGDEVAGLAPATATDVITPVVRAVRSALMSSRAWTRTGTPDGRARQQPVLVDGGIRIGWSWALLDRGVGLG
jgi:hypothetical protein